MNHDTTKCIHKNDPSHGFGDSGGVVGGSVFNPGESKAAQAARASSDLSGGKFPNIAHGEVVRTSGVITETGRFNGAQRDIPIAGHAGVLVYGAGPAGIGAALAEARARAQTRLIEVVGCLGGTWTAGLLTKIIDGERKRGIKKETLKVMSERGSLAARKSRMSLRISGVSGRHPHTDASSSLLPALRPLPRS